MNESTEILKRCSKCEKEKPLEEFWSHKGMKSGKYSSCIECAKEENKQNYIRHKEKRNESSLRNYYENRDHYLELAREKHQENPEEIIERAKQWAKDNPVKAKSNWRSSALKRKYGITLEQYQELLKIQNYQCAVCEKHIDKQKGNFHVDHAHTGSEFIPAGMIRGLLCWDCNLKLIGKRTNPFLYEKAATYLKQHTGWMVPSDQIKPKRKRKRKK